MKNPIKSFKCALRGIGYAISSGIHMRFHIVAAAYVLAFGGFYGFTAVKWVVLLLLIACVIAAEMFNTAIEELCNLVKDNYDTLAKAVKDIAAGAVLIISICAAVVGIRFFLDFETLKNIFFFFWNRPPLAALLFISFALSAAFVVLGTKGIRNLLFKLKNRIKKGH